MKAAKLVSRALLSVKGPESLPFLQSLLSNDLNQLPSAKCLYSFLLNAKGRIVSDLLVYAQPNDEILLETDAAQIALLDRNLRLYRLRRKVDIVKRDDLNVHFVFPDLTPSNGDAFPDPRLTSKFGYRLLSGSEVPSTAEESDYLRHRLTWGLGEGGEELADQIALNVNGDFLNGISYDKGCYIGQELIARTHHTGIIRRRLIPFRTLDPPVTVKANSDIVSPDGKRRGKVIRAVEGVGIGVVSVEAVSNKMPLASGGHDLEFYKPDWWPAQEKA
uniref:GCV_T domain-containing protein n=1 Tax=Panagrellus redivivus TaxID=6233 RepID=A0A7E4VMJ4_PANRE